MSDSLMTVLETRSVLTLLPLYHVVKMSQWKLTLLFGYQNVFEASLTFPFFLFSLHSISFFFLISLCIGRVLQHIILMILSSLSFFRSVTVQLSVPAALALLQKWKHRPIHHVSTQPQNNLLILCSRSNPRIK